MSRTYIRFTPRQRLEHAAMMTVFTLLVVTGLPQKFFEASLSVWILDLLGGVDRARWIHRACGLAFTGLALLHVGWVLSDVLRGRAGLSMVPTRKDFTDAVVTLRFYLGVSNEQTRFDRFDYRQKFEYWGLILGSIVVILTGLILLWPVTVATYLPGEVIPAAKVAHSNEGLLAFLTIAVWHIYNAHFNPDVFPFDTTIFTGRISEERMHHEHPLELERILHGPGGTHGTPGAPHDLEPGAPPAPGNGGDRRA